MKVLHLILLAFTALMDHEPKEQSSFFLISSTLRTPDGESIHVDLLPTSVLDSIILSRGHDVEVIHKKRGTRITSIYIADHFAFIRLNESYSSKITALDIDKYFKGRSYFDMTLFFEKNHLHVGYSLVPIPANRWDLSAPLFTAEVPPPAHTAFQQPDGSIILGFERPGGLFQGYWFANREDLDYYAERVFQLGDYIYPSKK